MEKVELNGQQLTPRELTVAEIEDVLLDLQKGELHPVEAYTHEIPVSAMAVAKSCGINSDDLKLLTPSQLKTLFHEVELANPSMAEQIDTLGALARRLLAEKDQTDSSQSPRQSIPSDETAAGSSPPDISR